MEAISKLCLRQWKHEWAINGVAGSMLAVFLKVRNSHLIHSSGSLCTCFLEELTSIFTIKVAILMVFERFKICCGLWDGTAQNRLN